MRQILTGREVWEMPEFKALCEKLGIDHSLPTTSLVIAQLHRSSEAKSP